MKRHSVYNVYTDQIDLGNAWYFIMYFDAKFDHITRCLNDSNGTNGTRGQLSTFRFT